MRADDQALNCKDKLQQTWLLNFNKCCVCVRVYVCVLQIKVIRIFFTIMARCILMYYFNNSK